MAALEDEYGLDDGGTERFTSSSSFNKFMMTDSKPINDQFHELQDYIGHLQLKDNQFSDDYNVSCPLINSFLPDQLYLETSVTSKVT